MQDAAIERYVLDDINNGAASLDGGNVVLDFVDSDGPGGSGAMALSKRYLWGERVDELLAQEDVTKNLTATDRVLWPVVDQLGTVRDLVKQDGTVATHFVYTSFGEVESGDTSLTRYLFTSREFDVDTGLQYNRARWYDAATGRWMSEDPIGLLAGDPNVNRYVGNDPVGKVDPSGLDKRKGTTPIDAIFGIGRHFREMIFGGGKGASIAEAVPGIAWSMLSVTGDIHNKASKARESALRRGRWDDYVFGIGINAVGEWTAYGVVSMPADWAMGKAIDWAVARPLHWAASKYVFPIVRRVWSKAPKGTATSPGAALRARLGAQFDEYMHFRNQGFTPAQAKYLTQPYGNRAGHHFPIPQRVGRGVLPDAVVDSRFNVLRPRGISLGRFYELHYRVDPYFNYARFPRSIGGGWNGNTLGLERYSGLQRIWYATPGPTKVAGGTGIVVVGAGGYWWFSSGDDGE